jgi:hypothetical protein
LAGARWLRRCSELFIARPTIAPTVPGMTCIR